nr:MBL fold metallo-hydrolase [Methylicorpusculum oleiharenae]
MHAGATLIIDGDRRILVDSGYFETAAELDSVLQKTVRLTREDLTDVYYTHLHYDHYRPLILGNPDLRFHMPQVEFQFIGELMQFRRDEKRFSAFLQETHELIAPVFLRQFLSFANDPRYELDVIADKNEIHLCQPSEQLTAHVKTVDLSGHCPGQLGLEIETGHGTGIVAGDAVICINDFLAQDTHHHLIVHNREKLLSSRQRVAQADFVIPGHGDWFDPSNNSLVTFQEKIL